jgi:hypothetical protein
MVDLANLPEKLSNRPSGTSTDVGANLYDWRALLLSYLRDLSAKVDKSVRRRASIIYCIMMSFTEEPLKICY